MVAGEKPLYPAGATDKSTELRESNGAWVSGAALLG